MGDRGREWADRVLGVGDSNGGSPDSCFIYWDHDPKKVEDYSFYGMFITLLAGTMTVVLA